MSSSRAATQTGGREATEGHIAGDVALAVGMPSTSTADGFVWRMLTDVARLETGHTPSRKISEYWEGGTLPWIGIRDATANHGREISATSEYITELGEQNSSTRLLPEGTVCLSRTASVGYVVVMGRPMCTSQDFVNWVCGPDLDHRYLKYILMAERGSFLRFAHGTTHQTIYFPEVKAFHVLIPPVADQRAIAGVLGALDDKIESNHRIAVKAESILTSLADSVRRLDLVPLSDVVTSHRKPSDPTKLGDELVDHYSIPAFDDSRLPERCSASTIKSGKHSLERRSVLVSRLNPSTPRVWLADPSDVPAMCSTEFLVLEPVDGHSIATVWLAAISEVFTDESAQRATGTSFSHQRIKPDDALSILVPDTRSADPAVIDEAEGLLEIALHSRREAAVASRLRDALLPELLSGRLRVRNAESLLEDEL